MSEHDTAVMATSSDAALCKLSTSSVGYFSDPFVQYFVKNASRRMPIINRGYYARVRAIHSLVSNFIRQHSAGKCQVVSLGAGLDTLFFRMKHDKDPQVDPSHVTYCEVDFPDITMRKLMALNRRKAMSSLIKLDEDEAFRAAMGAGGSELHTDGYHLIACDLRDTNKLQMKLEACGLDSGVPTLFLSECVFIYMEAEHSQQLVKWAGDLFQDVSFVLYEQILPDDSFGQVMLQNIKARGCDLLSIHDYPSLQAQRERFTSLGFGHVDAKDLNEIYYHFLDAKDREEKEKLEIFDEVEEFHLLQAHYCVVVASKEADGVAARALSLAG